MRSIAVAGHVCVDLRPELRGAASVAPGILAEIGPLTMTLGGAVGNTGRDLAALGAAPQVFTSVGDDALGTLVGVQLRDAGLPTHAVQVVPGASTSYSLVFEPPGADRTLWHHVGVNAAFDGAGLDLAGVDLLHLGYPPLLPALLEGDGEPLHRLLAGARAAGVTTSVDLAVVDPASPAGGLDWSSILARMAAQTDVLSPSLDDLTSALRIEEPFSYGLVERLAEQLLGWGCAVVALSAGEHGFFVATAGAGRFAVAGRALAARDRAWADRAFHLPPLPGEVPVTTTGAGDALTAGLLYGVAAGADIADVALLGSACAAARIAGQSTSPGVVCGLRPDLSHLFPDSPDHRRPGRGPTERYVMDPLVLPSNRPADRFYRGGARIAAFRGEPDLGPRTPEDWVGSTTTVRGEAEVGRTRLPDGRLLLDEITAHPEKWLGPDHVSTYGVDTRLLVKLLDAGQRLPVHAHPAGAFASEHLGASHGKAEAWFLLTAGEVHLGLTEPVGQERLRALVDGQRVEELLGLMHRVPVSAGQTVWVPPGLLHAIGEGILLAEVQEPEDLSILLEWRDFAIDGAVEGHLGLGFDLALRAVETRARSADEIAALIGDPDRTGSLLPSAADEFFLLERYVVDQTQSVPAGFGVSITIDGDLNLVGEDSRTVSAGAGSTILIPYAAGQILIGGHGTVLLARPPRP